MNDLEVNTSTFNKNTAVGLFFRPIFIRSLLLYVLQGRWKHHMNQPKSIFRSPILSTQPVWWSLLFEPTKYLHRTPYTQKIHKYFVPPQVMEVNGEYGSILPYISPPWSLDPSSGRDHLHP